LEEITDNNIITISGKIAHLCCLSQVKTTIMCPVQISNHLVVCMPLLSLFTVCLAHLNGFLGFLIA